MGRLSGVEREELWDRWEAGESQRSIGRRLGRSPSTVRTHLTSSGWKRPTEADEWCSLRLSLGEREEISRVSPVTSRCVLLLIGWGGLPRRCLVRSMPMVAL
jgi:hypothetical protein